jgi:PAS domain S-box-containing protein
VLRSASELDYPPLALVRADGSAEGFSVELLRAVLAAMGREVRFEVGTWSTIKQQLADGRLDVLPLVGRTPEREALFDFTVPYLMLHGTIVVRDAQTGIETFKDLKGRRVAVMAGDNAEEYLRREAVTERLVITPSYEEALRRLAGGELDAVVVQRMVAHRLIDKLGLDGLKVVERDLARFHQDFGFAVTEGDKELLALLNEGLAVVMADGTYERLREQWLGVLELDTRNRQLYHIAWAVGVTALLAWLVGMVWQRWLRQAALVESERHFRTLVETAPFGILEIDTEGEILYSSPAYARLLGYTPEELRGTNINDFLLADDRPRVQESMRRIAHELPKPATFFNRNRTRDGRLIKVQVDWNYKRDAGGRLIGFTIVVSDVTEQDRAQRALRESEQRFRATFEQAAVGIAHAAHNGRFLRVNQKLCCIFGYPEEELLQKSCKEITHPQDAAATMTAIRQLVTGEIDVARLEKRYIRKDGEILWCNFTSAVARGRDGRFKYFITVIEDIEERKRLEEQMQQHQLALARVGRINTMGEMATAIAHEINQPLMAIGNYAGGALQRLDASQAPDLRQRQALERIAALAERSGEIIEHLRNFTRRRKQPFRPVDINVVAEESFRMVAAKARNQQVALETELDPELPRIRGDRIQLEQVVINLLMNAMEAMEATEPERRRIAIETRTAAGNRIELVVSDRGSGLSEEVTQTLFDPFVTTKKQGTGMGLSISQTIASAHGGRIYVAPNPGGGTRFHLQLPIAIE